MHPAPSEAALSSPPHLSPNPTPCARHGTPGCRRCSLRAQLFFSSWCPTTASSPPLLWTTAGAGSICGVATAILVGVPDSRRSAGLRRHRGTEATSWGTGLLHGRVFCLALAFLAMMALALLNCSYRSYPAAHLKRNEWLRWMKKRDETAVFGGQTCDGLGVVVRNRVRHLGGLKGEGEIARGKTRTAEAEPVLHGHRNSNARFLNSRPADSGLFHGLAPRTHTHFFFTYSGVIQYSYALRCVTMFPRSRSAVHRNPAEAIRVLHAPPLHRLPIDSLHPHTLNTARYLFLDAAGRGGSTRRGGGASPRMTWRSGPRSDLTLKVYGNGASR